MLKRFVGDADLAAAWTVELHDQGHDDDDRSCEAGEQQKVHPTVVHPQERREADG